MGIFCVGPYLEKSTQRDEHGIGTDPAAAQALLAQLPHELWVGRHQGKKPGQHFCVDYTHP